MRHPVFATLCLGTALAVSGCQKASDAEVERAVKSVNVIDETNLNDIMLTVADPEEAVNYFKRASGEQPDRLDLKRGLARSLVRARHPTEAATVWAEITANSDSTPDDRVMYADALIRSGNWQKAETELNKVPPTHETYQRYKLEAMVADSKRDWRKADSFYETAVGMTTTPAGDLNNWGYSKLTRGDFTGAEKLFAEALTYDANLFTAKNNLVLARAGRHEYDLPIVEMTQTERAMLLYTAGLAAVKQGDLTIGKSLLREAVDTHPQYFEEAARALAALETPGAAAVPATRG